MTFARVFKSLFRQPEKTNLKIARPDTDLARSYLAVDDLEFGAHVKGVKAIIFDLLGYIYTLERINK